MLTISLRRWQGGTTLIEIMVALVILGLLVALGGSAAGDWLKNGQIRTAAESLQDGLQQARNEAVRRNVAVEFRILTSNSWEVRLADTTIANRVLASRSSAEGSALVTLTPSPAGASIVTFDGMGRRMSINVDGSNVLVGACADLPSSVLPSTRTRDLQVNVSLSGQIRMCDPKVAAADTRFCRDPIINPCGT